MLLVIFQIKVFIFTSLIPELSLITINLGNNNQKCLSNGKVIRHAKFTESYCLHSKDYYTEKTVLIQDIFITNRPQK